MGNILNGIYDVPRDARGRRLATNLITPTVTEIAQPIEIAVELPAALVGSFDVSNVESEIVESVEDETVENFDPSAHTVSEVLAYATENPDRVPEIVAAESAGKARKMILSLA